MLIVIVAVILVAVFALFVTEASACMLDGWRTHAESTHIRSQLPTARLNPYDASIMSLKEGRISHMFAPRGSYYYQDDARGCTRIRRFSPLERAVKERYRELRSESGR